MQAGQASGVGMVAVDPSRVAADYSYAAVVPKGAKIFGVGWDHRVGVVLIYSASVAAPVDTLVDDVVRLWFVPADQVVQCAPVGAKYLGAAVAAPDMVMCVFLATEED